MFLDTAFHRYGHKALLRYGGYVGIQSPMVDKVHGFPIASAHQ
jgi:hypothetical protein